MKPLTVLFFLLVLATAAVPENWYLKNDLTLPTGDDPGVTGISVQNGVLAFTLARTGPEQLNTIASKPIAIGSDKYTIEFLVKTDLKFVGTSPKSGFAVVLATFKNSDLFDSVAIGLNNQDVWTMDENSKLAVKQTSDGDWRKITLTLKEPTDTRADRLSVFLGSSSPAEYTGTVEVKDLTISGGGVVIEVPAFTEVREPTVQQPVTQQQTQVTLPAVNTDYLLFGGGAVVALLLLFYITTRKKPEKEAVTDEKTSSADRLAQLSSHFNK